MVSVVGLLLSVEPFRFPVLFTEPSQGLIPFSAPKGDGQDGGLKMGEREELLRLAYLKLMDAVELLQRVGEDLLADQTEGIAAKVGRSALATARA